MVRCDVKINGAEFRRAADRFFSNSKRAKRTVLTQQSRLFVRDVVKVTPPNRDWAFRPKAGERAIRKDIARIFRTARKGITNPAEVHQKYRNSRGRVRRELNPRIGVAGLPAYVKSVMARIGILASGWNAAAVKLGVRLPAWITRHGTKYGSCEIKVTDTSMLIRVVNAVRFIGDVKGIHRRVQWALDNRARQMDKQMDAFAVKQAARAAGLQVR